MDGDLFTLPPRKIGDLEIHPAAEDFPMIDAAGLAELAADIKANGQKFPIMLDATGKVLVDGRNRLAACKLAEVEPRFQCLDGENLESFIVSANVKRRNLTGQQRAIAAARAWSRARAEGKIQKQGGPRQKAQDALIADPRSHFAALYGVSERYVEMARDLYFDDPVAADGVRSGATDLRKAHDELMKRVGRQKGQDSRLRVLRQERPDLADRVGSGELDVEAASAIAKQDAAELKQQRWAVTVNLVDIIAAADRDPDRAPEVRELFDLVVEEQKGGQKITAERLRQAAAYLTALADCWEEELPQ